MKNQRPSKQNYNSDIYIMFTMNKLPKAKEEIPVDDAFQNFLQVFMSNSNYECSSGIASSLTREFLGKYKLACLSDEYKGCNEGDGTKLCQSYVKEVEDVYLYATNHKMTGLSIITMIIPQNSFKTTFILDQMATEHFYLKKESETDFTNINTFLLMEFDTKIIEQPKALVCMKEKPVDEVETLCILGCEAYQSEQVNYSQTSKEMLELTRRNFAQYDFYEIYASSKSILYILKDFKEDWLENFNAEISLLFICELLLFKIAAIARTNLKIKYHLSGDPKTTLKEIEQLHNEFKATVVFWDINIFKYSLAQQVYDNLHESFKVEDYYTAYKNNHSHLEHLVNIKGGQAAELEGAVMNCIAVALAVFQLLPLILSGQESDRMLLGSGSSVLAIFLLLYFAKRLRKRKK